MAMLLWVVLGVVCFVGSLGAFVLALLKPRTGPMSERQQAALAAVRKTFNFAHRGLFDNVTVPENSLAAFKKAVDHGYGFEFDVQLTADNKLAISHDDTICARLYEPSPKHSVDSLFFSFLLFCRVFPFSLFTRRCCGFLNSHWEAYQRGDIRGHC